MNTVSDFSRTALPVSRNCVFLSMDHAPMRSRWAGYRLVAFFTIFWPLLPARMSQDGVLIYPLQMKMKRKNLLLRVLQTASRNG
ncbi:hypothetical protein DFS34DRAFT_710923, partial [Phlyctochytrium arcticum]